MGFKQTFGKFFGGFLHHGDKTRPEHINVDTSETKIQPFLMTDYDEPPPVKQPPPVPPSVFPQMQGKPITAETAQQVFDFLSAMDDIAFKYPRDGCYARAHLMCRRLIDMDQSPSKAWAFSGGNGYLEVNAPNGKTIEWSWHVAPVLPVEMPNGRVIGMVFDPSLFDGPVTFKAWGEIMKADMNCVHSADCGACPPGKHGDYMPSEKTTAQTDSSAAKTMKEYLPHQYDGPRSVFPSKFDELVLAESKPQATVSAVTALSEQKQEAVTVRPIIKVGQQGTGM